MTRRRLFAQAASIAAVRDCAVGCAANTSPRVSAPGDILGYGGLWKIEGEAHISTIAIHPANRGLGYGEILLAGMFGKALQLNAEFIVLEVRVSNSVAQALYKKYGFNRVARKKNYYRSRQRRCLGHAGVAGSRYAPSLRAAIPEAAPATRLQRQLQPYFPPAGVMPS